MVAKLLLPISLCFSLLSPSRKTGVLRDSNACLFVCSFVCLTSETLGPRSHHRCPICLLPVKNSRAVKFMLEAGTYSWPP